MNKTVIFHLGAARDDILAGKAWEDNPDAVSDFGERPSHRGLGAVFPPNVENKPVVLPSGGNIYYVHAYTFLTSRAYLRREDWQMRFSGCRMRAFLSLVRQDKALDAFFAWRCLGGWQISPQQLAATPSVIRQMDYAAALHHAFQLFGRKNTGLHVDGNGEAPGSALDAFLRFTFPSEPAADVRYPRPNMSLSLPREFLRFTRACAALTVTLQTPWDSPWIAQSAHFEEQSPRSFFSPGERRDFLAGFAVSNEAAAKVIGLDRLFFDVDDEPDWEPFIGLTPEIACKVAERLDRDFACDRMAELDAAPVHFLTREQRIVRHALHDVLDPPSSVPLLRPRVEPKLSVLTLAYNHAKFIVRNIEEVIAQQVDFPMQHIIADDGSDDGTQDIILKYAAKYPHIVPLFRKDRKTTPWNNIHALFDMARTEYVALCDGDDYFTDPLKLQTQVDFLDAHKDCSLCFHVVRVTYEDDPARERLHPPLEALPRGVRPVYYLVDLLRFNFIQTNSVVYRWRFKDGLPDWFRTDLCPGDWYWHLLHAEQGKIGFINKVMSVYRRHEKGIYYLSETNRLKHRHAVGMDELKVYDAVNRHFNGRYASILGDMANGVIADWLMYTETEDATLLLEAATDRFPHFAEYFLQQLEKKRTIPAN